MRLAARPSRHPTLSVSTNNGPRSRCGGSTGGGVPGRPGLVRRRLLPLMLLLSTAGGKIMNGQLQLTSDVTEQFLTKFSFSSDRAGRLEGSFGGHGKRFKDDGNGRHQLQLALFSDTAWPKYLDAIKSGSLCSERMQLATSKKVLKAKGAYDKEARKAGKPVVEFSISEDFQPQTRSHYYYFVLADCSLEFYPAHPPTLDYEFHLTNGRSELPADEDGLLVINLLASLGLGAACAFAAVGLQKQLKRYGQVHLSAAAVAAGLLLQAAACVFELLHLVAYARDGKGLRWRHGRLPLDFWSDTCQNLSELVVVVVVVSVGCGWTLVDGTFRQMSKVAATAGGLALFQFGLELLSRRYEEDFSSFHDHDHWPGKLLMLMRAACCALVFSGTRKAVKKLGNAGDTAGGRFLTRFAFVGMAWLLAFPFTVLIVAPAVSPYHRHCVVESAAIVIQSLAVVGLLVLFLGVGDHGKSFLKNSTINNMGDLDMGGGGGGGGGLGGGGLGGGGSVGQRGVSGALSSGLATTVKAVRRKVSVD